MILWSGKGYLVIVMALAAILAVNLATDYVLFQPGYYKATGWPKLMGLCLAALPTWWLGVHLNRAKGKVLIDPETGREVILPNNHSLFFLPMQYWAFVLVAFGIVMFFTGQ